MRARIAAGGGVGPWGLAPTRARQGVYRHAVEGNPVVFGRVLSLRCPHYVEETGGCGVWAWREATCATWFCKQDRGATGQAFCTPVRTGTPAFAAPRG